MRRSKRLLAGRVPCRCAEARAGPRYRILRFVETKNAVSVITRPAINRIPKVRITLTAATYHAVCSKLPRTRLGSPSHVRTGQCLSRGGAGAFDGGAV
jgi:hypothetical protein